MITGIAVLGLLSGSLASFFRLGRHEQGSQGDDGAPVPAHAATTDVDGSGLTAVLQSLTREVAELRREVQALRDGGSGGSPGRGERA
jgi:hypothetical protein